MSAFLAFIIPKSYATCQNVCQFAEKISVKHNEKANHRTQNPVFDFSGNKGVLDELDSTEPTKTIQICGLLNLLLNSMLEKGALIPERKNEPKYNNYHQIINYISDNFKRDIHLSDMAKKLG